MVYLCNSLHSSRHDCFELCSAEIKVRDSSGKLICNGFAPCSVDEATSQSHGGKADQGFIDDDPRKFMVRECVQEERYIYSYDFASNLGLCPRLAVYTIRGRSEVSTMMVDDVFIKHSLPGGGRSYVLVSTVARDYYPFHFIIKLLGKTSFNSGPIRPAGT